MKKVECIIMDWAGTSVDYGCMAPVAAFVESFKNIGLEVTPEETRAFMGLTKIEEIRALFAIERVAEDFRLKFGRDYDDSDVQGRYNDFQRVLFATLEDYSEPIPGIVETNYAVAESGHQGWFDNRIYPSDDGRGSPCCGSERLCDRQLCNLRSVTCWASLPVYGLPKHDRFGCLFGRLRIKIW